MIVCIEGCIGVGKTSLTRKLDDALGGQCIFEAYENNPFLQDFYDNPDIFAFHVQSTFLCLQSKQFMKVDALANGKHVFIDFHPVKSKIFSEMIIRNEEELDIIHKMYNRLFPSVYEEIMIVYLHASPEVIFERIKLRNDRFASRISFEYIKNLSQKYNDYFEKYSGHLVSIDTDALDFVKNDDDWMVVREKILMHMR